MGNIQRLTRDQITRDYHHFGNQLISLTGGPEHGSYQYDPNGNVRFDARNSQAIEYNVLNLPSNIPEQTYLIFTML